MMTEFIFLFLDELSL